MFTSRILRSVKKYESIDSIIQKVKVKKFENRINNYKDPRVVENIIDYKINITRKNKSFYFPYLASASIYSIAYFNNVHLDVLNLMNEQYVTPGFTTFGLFMSSYAIFKINKKYNKLCEKKLNKLYMMQDIINSKYFDNKDKEDKEDKEDKDKKIIYDNDSLKKYSELISYMNESEDGQVIERSNGDKYWYLNDKLHRENGPAVEKSNGDKWWYLNGVVHRENGPAVKYKNGDKEWYLHDKRHRENGPAVKYKNGDKEWWFNGKLHREDGPVIEYINGDKWWYSNGVVHREDGPAIECSNGDKRWYSNGVVHRENGPAMKFSNGDKYWYLNGKLHRENGPAVKHSTGYKAWYLNGKKQCDNIYI